jgi:molybdopterin converting factor small subunit
VPQLAFTAHLRDVIDIAPRDVSGDTVGAVLNAAFDEAPTARGYVLDDAGRVRKHVAIFLNNKREDPAHVLDMPVTDACEIYVMQALSGG